MEESHKNDVEDVYLILINTIDTYSVSNEEFAEYLTPLLEKINNIIEENINTYKNLSELERYHYDREIIKKKRFPWIFTYYIKYRKYFHNCFLSYTRNC